MEYLEASAAIIGLVNGFRLLETNRKGFFYFLGGLAVGVVAGALHYFGLPSIEAGVITALAASGLYRVSQKVGGSD